MLMSTADSYLQPEVQSYGSFPNTHGKTASFFKTSSKVVGNVVWIVTTSALLIGLPLALSLEDEAKVVQQEKELLAQQQGAQNVSVPYV